MVKVIWNENPFDGRNVGDVEEMENDNLAASYIAAGLCSLEDKPPAAVKNRNTRSAAAGEE